MKTRNLLVLVSMLLPSIGLTHEGPEKLGKVVFPTSCDPKVQVDFERGVAMVHSYWFGPARKTFEAVLQQDPTCAIAYWGIALDYLGNMLAAPPSAKDAQLAWEALQKAHAIGAKTPREREWIDALSAYFRDHDKVAVDVRTRAYDKAMSEIAQRYPKDPEAQVFYALTLQASAPKTDRKYSNQLKSAEILEKLLPQYADHPGVTHFLIHAYDYPPLAMGPGSALGTHTGLASMQARLVLESADWKGAAALPVYASSFPAANSLNRFARGLGMARSGDLSGAKAEIDAIKALRAALEKADNSYWAGRSEEHMLALSAWVTYAEGNRDQAIKFMRAAADLEDARVKHVAMENELYPLRELLADLLLEAGQPALALREFETSLKATPNRYRGTYGAARAAEAVGERQKAQGYFAKLVELARNGDTTRPELAKAKAYLAQR